MSSLSLNSNPDSTNLAVPKLRDDGSNWANYSSRIQKAMGSKGLWRHVEGNAVTPKPYTVVNGTPVTSDGKTAATEEQIEARETRIIDYEKREYLVQHVILSTTSTRLGAKIKDLKTAKEMWDQVKSDATTKSTLYLLDAEDELASMKLGDTEDPKTHLAELKEHFQLMVQRYTNLIAMGSVLSDFRYRTIIMHSLPESYRPALQTITAAERAGAVSGAPSTSKMKPDDLMNFFIEEAQHRVINAERSKNGDSALAAQGKKGNRGHGNRGKKPKSGVTCENCGKPGHTKPDCYSKGGGKEGQGPRQKKKKEKKSEESAAVAKSEENELFAFTCTSDYVALTEVLKLPKDKFGACMDSGASDHYCPDRTKFENYRPLDNRNITTADGRTLKAVGIGDVHIELPNGSKRTPALLKDAIYSPDMAFTLISVGHLDKADCAVSFQKGMCTIRNPKGRIMGTIPRANGLYRLVNFSKGTSLDHANVAVGKMSISEAHRKLGHISHSAIRNAISTGQITGIELDMDSKPEFCEPCAKAKSARLPFPQKSDTHATKYGERVHWDLWGPASVRSLSGNYYVAARTDDHTRENKLYFQPKKSDTFKSYKRDEALIETQSGNKIKVSRSDRGGEFLSKEIIQHQDGKGTLRELTVHDSPPQNGVAERGMRTRAELARALLISSGLPRFLWEEAMKHVEWLKAQSPHRALDGKTPYEMKHKKKPHLGGIHEFGPAAYVKDLKAGKLDSRAQLGRFVGYDSESKGFRIYWPNKRSVTVERNVVFNDSDVTTDTTAVIPGDLSEGEKEKIIQVPETNTNRTEEDAAENAANPDNISSNSAPDSEEQNSVPFPSPPEASDAIPRDPIEEPDVEPALGRGRRVQKKPPGAYKRMAEALPPLEANIVSLADPDDDEIGISLPKDDDDIFATIPPDFATVGAMGTEPASIDEALRGPNAKEWQAALDYEINQLEKLGTWVIEDLPPGQTAIPNSIVLKEKKGPDGEIETYRVWIVAGGHKQVHGVNYTETFSAAAKMPSVRVVLANAAEQDWEIHHVDINSAYLNAPLKETVYMKPPRGVLKPGQEGKVCRLLKGLYGLKQAGRGWHQELTKVFITDLGFKRSAVDHSVFIRQTPDEHSIVAVATDDMAITSKRMMDVEKFKSELRRYWEISDKGELSWFLGFEVKRNRAARTISINQRAYIDAMLDKFRLTNTKPVATPMETGAQLSKDQGPSTLSQENRMRGIPYAEAIGCALWPVVISRPDAAFAIGILSQFIQNPGLAHWEALKRVIVYLGSTKDFWLTFGGRTKIFTQGFCDADWASQKDRHSISGYCYHIGQGTISWSSKKQQIVALSTTEAEYIAQSHAAKEALWLRTFIGELRGKPTQPLTIHCDNQGAIALSKDNKFHARTKHIDIRHHFIREAIEDWKLSVVYIPTDDNPADIFTKPLAKAKFRRFVELLGLREIDAKNKR